MIQTSMNKSSEARIDFCSFRDPSGIVLKYNGRILRLIRKEHEGHLRKILENPQICNFIDDRVVPASKIVPESEFVQLVQELPSIDHAEYSEFSICVEHELIPFPSYPYEWAPEMLHCAAQLTVELCLKLSAQNLGIKDASPYNVLFLGANPIFVDFLSFEARDPLDHVWLPYAQFIRTFILPLVVYRYNKTPLSQIFFNRSDGLELEEIYAMTSRLNLIKPGIFTLVTLPMLFSRLAGLVREPKIYQKQSASSVDLAKFILERIFKGLKKHLNNFKPKPKSSKWTNYFAKEESYSFEEFERKERIVLGFLRRSKPERVLDIGCNLGHFSILAAKNNASVVAIDSDAAVISALWCKARKDSLDILPLVVDICRPSPSTGWCNGEHLSFLQRSKGAFDTVMMLAVVHHLTVTSRIPLEEIAKMCAEIAVRTLIIEFISPEDPLFCKIVRGRDALYAHLTMGYFENIFGKYFTLIAKEQSGKHRWIYYYEKKREL